MQIAHLIFSISTSNLMIIIQLCLSVLPEPFYPIPRRQQLEYSKLETIAFIHFGMNTFTDREWGNGTEDEKLFNPTLLNASQWVSVLKDGGFRQIIFTAKHHDGFCLWPSKATNHSVAQSPWKNGKGDVVREFTEACAKYGVRASIYLSPWDMNSKCYGHPEVCDYNDLYIKQERELLGNYGPIYEQWLDGAKGEDLPQDYNFQQWREVARSLQPDILIWGTSAPDCRWSGNEQGNFMDEVWSKIIKKPQPDLYNGQRENIFTASSGAPQGDWWSPAEADFSIRPGWFYHQSQDGKVKTVEQLVKQYFNTVGSNQVMLLNVPPNKQGLFHETDVKNVLGFGKAINATFSNNLLRKGTVKVVANSTFDDNAADNILNEDYDKVWAAAQNASELIIERSDASPFDIIMLQEYIPLGQSIKEFQIFDLDGEEKQLCAGKTIGYKRLFKLEAPIVTRKFKIVIKSNAPAVLNTFALFKLDYANE